MLKKAAALWKLFRKGEEVGDVEKWKAGQVSVNAVIGIVAALFATASAFGFELPATEDQIGAIGAGVFAVANIVLTVVTSRRAGLPGRDDGNASADQDRPGNHFDQTD